MIAVYELLLMIMIMINIMSMRRDYVSELRPPAGLSFISQVIYAYGHAEP
jgi:hypothetical protein